MRMELHTCLEQNPVIAAISDDKWESALESPAQVLFYLSASLLTVKERIAQVHAQGRYVLGEVINRKSSVRGL